MESIKIPKHFPFVLNQLFEIENKLRSINEPNSIQRNLDRMKDYFEKDALADGQGLVYYNPLGESYNETRTDCEASISGSSHENLEIIEVLKPIIYFKYFNTQTIIQKAIVIVQSKNLN
jgi:hypothetical protein